MSLQLLMLLACSSTSKKPVCDKCDAQGLAAQSVVHANPVCVRLKKASTTHAGNTTSG